MPGTMYPIYKFNGGRGATLCHKCSVIINNGFSNKIYCKKCESIMQMRPKQRIPVFLKEVNWQSLIGLLWEMDGDEKTEYTKRLNEKFDEMVEYWMKNPDLRVTQVLVNMGIIPNKQGFWYYKEDHELLIELGREARDIVLWGVNYTKGMKLLPKTKWTPIKDLATDHIQAILDGGYARGNSFYINLFKEELKLREST